MQGIQALMGQFRIPRQLRRQLRKWVVRARAQWAHARTPLTRVHGNSRQRTARRTLWRGVCVYVSSCGSTHAVVRAVGTLRHPAHADASAVGSVPHKRCCGHFVQRHAPRGTTQHDTAHSTARTAPSQARSRTAIRASRCRAAHTRSPTTAPPFTGRRTAPAAHRRPATCCRTCPRTLDATSCGSP